MTYKTKRLTLGKLSPAIAGRLYTPDEAAQYLGVAPQTLAHWRVNGSGPKFVHLTKRCIRYSETALRSWVEERTQASTAENARHE